jgi:hypothetical protein
MKTAWYWHKNRYGNQWNRIEDLDVKPQNYIHLLFNQRSKNIQWRKSVSSTNMARESGYLPAEN